MQSFEFRRVAVTLYGSRLSRKQSTLHQRSAAHATGRLPTRCRPHWPTTADASFVATPTFLAVMCALCIPAGHYSFTGGGERRQIRNKKMPQIRRPRTESGNTVRANLAVGAMLSNDAQPRTSSLSPTGTSRALHSKCVMLKKNQLLTRLAMWTARLGICATHQCGSHPEGRSFIYLSYIDPIVDIITT